MNNLSITSENLHKVSSFMIQLDKTAFDKKFQYDAYIILLDSLKTAWKAYNFTKIQFSGGDSLISIIDHYFNALIEITRAIYEVINSETKQQLSSYLIKE